MSERKLSRRSFLKGVGASALAASALGVITPAPVAAEATTAPVTDGKPSFFTDPFGYTEADAAKVIQTEVVIVGAGNAGCAAACSAVEHGSRVIVLEAQNAIHGQGGGIGLCNTKFVKQLVAEGKLESETDIQYHQNIWIQRCGSRVKESLVSMWFNKGEEAGNWLIDKAAEYGVTPRSFRAYAPKAAIPESYDYHCWRSDGSYTFPKETTYFVATSVLYVDSMNAEKYEHPADYFFETKAQELYKDETGRVAGVFAVKDGELILFKASKGVVLATGGIHEDKEMVEYYCDDFVNRVQRCEHGPVGFSTGDGHKMGLWAGAKMQDGPFPLMLHPQANAMFHGCFPFLNQRGERFMNEGTWVQGKSMNIMHQPGNYAWSVFDKNWAHYNTLSLETGEGGGMFWDSMAGAIGQPFTDDDLVATVESDIANGNTIKADTLEELAEKTGMPYETLKASLDRYNALVEAGEDTDFRKANSMLFPVKEGPFYAAKVGIALLAIVGGLMVDDNLNVVDDNDQPIPGLYAIGNASGGTYAIDYPINMAGNSNGRCLIWGYLAGKTLGGVESTVACTDIASCGVVPGPVEHTVVDATVYKDGVYNGVGTGRNGDIEVAVTIEGGKISGIEVVRQAETDNIGVPAFEKLIANAVKGNTAAVDTVGGATMTTDGFREAVAAALELAK